MGGAAPVLPAAPMAPRRPLPGQEAAAAMRRRQAAMTRVIDLQGSGLGAGAVPVVIGLGGPPSGFAWDLKSLVVGPEDFTVVPYPAANTVQVIVFGRSGALAGGAGAPNADTTATNVLGYNSGGLYPYQQYWGRHEASILYPYVVELVVIGVAAGVVITAGGQAEQTAVNVEEIKSL
jgi:hypothetical protein